MFMYMYINVYVRTCNCMHSVAEGRAIRLQQCSTLELLLEISRNLDTCMYEMVSVQVCVGGGGMGLVQLLYLYMYMYMYMVYCAV